jgi:hypothetical protein
MFLKPEWGQRNGARLIATDVRNNILMIATTVNIPADSLCELIEVSLVECRQVGHRLGGAGG